MSETRPQICLFEKTKEICGLWQAQLFDAVILQNTFLVCKPMILIAT